MSEGLISGYNSFLSSHEFLSDSLFDEKSSVYFKEEERLDLKAQAVSFALREDDLSTLQKLGASRSGFVNHSLRRRAWSKLLNSTMTVDTSLSDNSESLPHKDEHQVSLDVKRTFGSVEDQQTKEFLRQTLESTIVRMLRKYPQLSYYQGYHDVVSVFVLVFTQEGRLDDDQGSSECTSREVSIDGSDDQENLSNSSSSTKLLDDSLLLVDSDALFEAVEVFTLVYLRDFLMSSLAFTIDQLKVIPWIVKKKDEEFYNKFQLAKIDPFFALSSILTIFSHDLKSCCNDDRGIVFQIFDLVISFQSMMVPLIIYSELLLAKKQVLLKKYEENIENFDNDTDLVHGVIQQVMCLDFGIDFWSEVLDYTRVSMENSSWKPTKTVNKYSVLVKNVKQIEEPLLLSQVLSWLSKEMKLNQERSMSEAFNRKGDHKRGIITKWQKLIHGGGFGLVKFSIALGLAAILLKVYIQTIQGDHTFSLASYAGHVKPLKLLGLNQPDRFWIDPLKNLLKAPSRSNFL
ncbi:LAFE_0B08768g1_1 [Lachancea fermentati]|uniref:LAFE_0B08768g1_1 n=1 Tax=Lachancea fermentati TaxID=4955 RepID=A0A1G4M8J2_LACFM|nr:LAFE_0B08768g1_1 [Lachancea fermentati]